MILARKWRAHVVCVSVCVCVREREREGERERERETNQPFTELEKL